MKRGMSEEERSLLKSTHFRLEALFKDLEDLKKQVSVVRGTLDEVQSSLPEPSKLMETQMWRSILDLKTKQLQNYLRKLDFEGTGFIDVGVLAVALQRVRQSKASGLDGSVLPQCVSTVIDSISISMDGDENESVFYYPTLCEGLMMKQQLITKTECDKEWQSFREYLVCSTNSILLSDKDRPLRIFYKLDRWDDCLCFELPFSMMKTQSNKDISLHSVLHWMMEHFDNVQSTSDQLDIESIARIHTLSVKKKAGWRVILDHQSTPDISSVLSSPLELTERNTHFELGLWLLTKKFLNDEQGFRWPICDS